MYLQGLCKGSEQLGLAAAVVRKPTVAQYGRCFRHLQLAKLATESGPYGEAPHHEGMVVLDNFPEKGRSIGARRVRKFLKRQALSSPTFLKRPLLGRVHHVTHSLTDALLP